MDTQEQLLTLLDASKQHGWEHLKWEPTAHGAELTYRDEQGTYPVPADLRRNIGLYDLSAAEAEQFENDVMQELDLELSDRNAQRTLSADGAEVRFLATSKGKIIIPTDQWRPLFVFHGIEIAARV